MERKIIKQKSGGHTIFLPAGWVKDLKLGQNTSVFIKREGNSLVIKANSHLTKQIKLSFGKFVEKVIGTLISSLYRIGFSEIFLEFDEPIPYIKLERAVLRSKGYEIFNQDKKSCIIRSMALDCDINADKLILKIFQLTFWILESNIEREYFREELLRYRNLCQRLIIKKESGLSHELYTFVLVLEKIGWVHYKLGDKKLGKRAKETLEELNRLLRLIYKAFASKKFSTTYALYQQTHKLCRSFFERKIINPEDNCLLYYLSELLMTLSGRLMVISSQNV